MFARFKSTVVLSAVASLALTGAVANPVSGACNQGTISCCNTVQSPTTVQQGGAEGLNGLLDGLLGGLLGSLDLGDILRLASGYDGDIGIGCSSGGGTCEQQSVCCKDTAFEGGLINVGCNIVDL